jgi:hypothetical protein
VSDNFNVVGSAGTVITIGAKDTGSGVYATYHRQTDGSGNFTPAMDAAARAGYQIITDGTNTLPTGDAVGRAVLVGVVPNGTPIYATVSAGATQNVATLVIPSAKTGYLDGFDLDGLGATSGSAINVTVGGILGGTLTFAVGIPAGATVPFHQSFRFNPPLKASAANTNIVVTVPSYGTGNTAASVNAFGRYF